MKKRVTPEGELARKIIDKAARKSKNLIVQIVGGPRSPRNVCERMIQILHVELAKYRGKLFVARVPRQPLLIIVREVKRNQPRSGTLVEFRKNHDAFDSAGEILKFAP